ncbi:MAG: hypothetical protein K0S61_3297 [Anaerocolumna sp.]|jgi:hypothetical protein|nr:hypothetical protein [Anaerocolumna sp.]
MNTYQVDLNALSASGHVVKNMVNDICHITANKRVSTNFEYKHLPVNSYVAIPKVCKLPFRFDLCIKIDTPEFYLLIGNGHLTFGSFWSDNRRIDDIIAPNYKPNVFHNHIPLNEFVNISVIYDFHFMEVLVNEEVRYYSEKERYMKANIRKEFEETALPIKLSCSKQTDLCIKHITVTEFDESIPHSIIYYKIPSPITRNEAVPLGEKPTLESCISLLPQLLQDEIIKTDVFLRTLKPMKFKRQFEKNGNKISYLASDHGFSYNIYPSNDILYHSLSWYIITNGKPELWHRKTDLMEITLNKIAETNEAFAEKMFTNLKECIGCCPCIVKTLYKFNGKKKMSCHGLMDFKMHSLDFEDVRYFIQVVNDLDRV